MSNTIPALQPPRILDAALISSESSIMQGHHRVAQHAWLADDDITAFMAEPDDWTVEELLAGRI